MATQVIVVNYEDKHTTMEAPDDQDEISYRCCSVPTPAAAPLMVVVCAGMLAAATQVNLGCSGQGSCHKTAVGRAELLANEPTKGLPARRYLMNITIPAAFITKSDGQVLKDLFKRSGSSPAEDVYIVMDWNDVLPRAQKVPCTAGDCLSLVACAAAEC